VHDELIRALLDPARYPHAVESLQVRETHISWVLLTGQYAYKIKKPVRLPFLDFSTLELRKHFCEEEVRLNRRFAPQLYLDVVPITGTRSSPRIDGAGTAIEYAVKLKQFASSNELASLVANDSVDCDDLRRFGRDLARMHETAPQAALTALENWQLGAKKNLTELAQLLPSHGERLATVAQQLSALTSKWAALIAERYASDAIRECHGDLHIGNVVRIDGKLVPFDCIEFDAALRNVDVLNDAAFLAMDLEAHGHRDLAYCFLNGWLEESGHYTALPLLPSYAAQRALVRAKVAALQDERSQLIELYISEAERRLAPTQPRLIVTCGLSGSGKTWLSQQLAAALPAMHVRSDIERKRLAGLTALASSRSTTGAGIYTQEFNARTYARLLECARASLDAGESVIADAAFLRRNERQLFASLSDELRVPFTILHCAAPDQTLRDRIESRQRKAQDASEATVDVLVQQHGYWEPFDAGELLHVLEVDTSVDSSIAIAERLRNRQSEFTK